MLRGGPDKACQCPFFVSSLSGIFGGIGASRGCLENVLSVSPPSVSFVPHRVQSQRSGPRPPLPFFFLKLTRTSLIFLKPCFPPKKPNLYSDVNN